MRGVRFALLLVALAASTPAAAQEWIDFTSKDDHFIVNLPGQPQATPRE